jgi:pSer/pThr/pTyr-binding forkhead associated (FHA) protein
MPVTLFLVSGPYSGQQIQIGARQLIRIGRTDRSDYPLPNDTYLSGAHFEIGWNEQQCRIRDLGSSNGTFVNGVKVDHVVVQEGDQISAGETTFVVRVTQGEPDAEPLARPAPAATPPAGIPVASLERTARMQLLQPQPPREGSSSQLSEVQRRVHQSLTQQNAPVYVVVDALQVPNMIGLLQSPGLRAQLLFDEPEGRQAPSHAPYLVELGRRELEGERREGQDFLASLLQLRWGKGCGVFVTSLSSFEDVLWHFRHFLLVGTKTQGVVPLRFYDPRVVRALLPTCEPQEINAVFGPVVSYLVEGERPDELLEFSNGAEGLITATIALTEERSKVQAAGS